MAWWNANISGKDEDFKKKEEAQNQIDEALADKEHFAELKAIKQLKRQGRDRRQGRSPAQIDVLYLHVPRKAGRPGAARRRSPAKANAVEKTFNVFRAKVDGKEMTDSEVREVLKESSDSERRQAVWEASKGVGAEVEKRPEGTGQARATRRRRSSASRTSTPCMLYLNEQDGDELIKLFDELDELTREPFPKAKAEIDERLAKNCGVKVERPDAVALPRSVLPGVAGRLRRQPRRAVRQGGHPASSAATSTRASACRSTT